ncbi:ALP1-like protein [Tanacetum coccineum]|uniref:ALP1-like protein n=1 Tax=Tanacetum coccineum TaxID=301880 RepID=A0ABQ5HUH7_9ASTR
MNMNSEAIMLQDVKDLYAEEEEKGIISEIPFVTNDVSYSWGYYLCDEIYPEWVTFVKAISNLVGDDYKRLRYKRMYEAAKKDVEPAFGVLEKKWAILANPIHGSKRRAKASQRREA